MQDFIVLWRGTTKQLQFSVLRLNSADNCKCQTQTVKHKALRCGHFRAFHSHPNLVGGDRSAALKSLLSEPHGAAPSVPQDWFLESVCHSWVLLCGHVNWEPKIGLRSDLDPTALWTELTTPQFSPKHLLVTVVIGAQMSQNRPNFLETGTPWLSSGQN